MIAFKEKTETVRSDEVRISILLNHVGIMPHLAGFTYLKAEAMFLLSEHGIPHHAMKLYQMTAEKFRISPNSVERSVRYAINYAYIHSHDKLQKFMNSEDVHIPAHFEFVSLLAENIWI